MRISLKYDQDQLSLKYDQDLLSLKCDQDPLSLKYDQDQLALKCSVVSRSELAPDQSRLRLTIVQARRRRRLLTIADVVVLHGQFPPDFLAVVAGESSQFLPFLRLLQLALHHLPVELTLTLLHRPEIGGTARRRPLRGKGTREFLVATKRLCISRFVGRSVCRSVV